MNKIKRNTANFVILLILIALLGTEFFHHHDSTFSSKDNSHCQACLRVNILHTTVNIDCEIKFFNSEFEIRNIQTACTITEINFPKSISARAPPVL